MNATDRAVPGLPPYAFDVHGACGGIAEPRPQIVGSPVHELGAEFHRHVPNRIVDGKNAPAHAVAGFEDRDAYASRVQHSGRTQPSGASADHDDVESPFHQERRFKRCAVKRAMKDAAPPRPQARRRVIVVRRSEARSEAPEGR
jgi:hypothetical protein